MRRENDRISGYGLPSHPSPPPPHRPLSHTGALRIPSRPIITRQSNLRAMRSYHPIGTRSIGASSAVAGCKRGILYARAVGDKDANVATKFHWVDQAD